MESIQLLQVETNIDDATGEQISFLQQKLIDIGANDCFVVPIQMKKGRSAIQLSVLFEKKLLRQVSEVLFQSSPTIGFRISEVQRIHLPRRILLTKTSAGPVRVKACQYTIGKSPAPMESGQGGWKMKAEFDDCQQLALATDRSIRQVAEEAEQIALKMIIKEESFAIAEDNDAGASR